ncbi:hypothetical protein Taro_006437 [Colocasia esculenta]|uniref:Isoamylase 1-3-like C-terminal domain-containing protein n=1 Tax=Colocasia esculenta TaxID=4460 RepID=A0A843TNQ5_COLES|nr:hypothetical protein [Colocasia esculenta]
MQIDFGRIGIWIAMGHGQSSQFRPILADSVWIGIGGGPIPVPNLIRNSMDAIASAFLWKDTNSFIMHILEKGTPMMLMGDEYGHTRYGNNNSYGHDTQINHFLWHQLEERRTSHFRFFSEMIKYRLKHHILGRDRFLGKNDITWHEDNWGNPDSKFLAFTLHDEEFGGDIYLAFNAHDYFVHATVPSPPHQKCWHRVVDTNLKSPEDFVPDGIPFSKTVYNIAPYSSILLQAKP